MHFNNYQLYTTDILLAGPSFVNFLLTIEVLKLTAKSS